MPNDFKKKEPSKADRMFYELAMHQQMFERNLASNSAFVAAIGLTLKVDPKVVAKLLTTDHEQIKKYSDEINAEIDRIEKEKKAQETASAPKAEGTDTEVIN